jgi:hypothetical protein
MVRKIGWNFYVISGLITLLVLMVGIFMGLFLSEKKVEILEKSLQEMKIGDDDTSTQFLLLPYFGNKSCEVIGENFYKIQMEAAKLGDKVETYEREEKVKDPAFIPLKKMYTLTSIKYWYYTKQLKEECGKQFVPILYFYSNVYCPDCPKQGVALGYLKHKYPQNVMIFSLDFDIELDTIKLLRLAYNVKTVPSLVIDDKTYNGLIGIDQLEEIIEQELAK